MEIFKQIKSIRYFPLFTGVALAIFNVYFYLMRNLPGTRNFACVQGANLTFLNIGYSIISSVLMGLVVVGFLALFRNRRIKGGISGLSFSSAGLLFGTFTVFCTVCTLPVISVFGLSVGLSFFTNYNLLFKSLSLGLLVLAFFLLEKQLAKGCERCVAERLKT